MILGITGGLGCGKSTAARLFEKRGYRRLDSDQLVREKVLTDPGVVDAVKGYFGTGVLSPEGVIDRVKLGRRVFSNDTELHWLESITHPMVHDLWREALDGSGTRESVSWALEVPLLFEGKTENWFDFTLCVACAPTQQIARLELRGIDRALARQRISKQLPLARKIELADFVLWNDGSAAFLEVQVDRLVEAWEAIRAVDS